MYYPTLDEVAQLKQHGNLVPVCYEIMADLETPVSAYLKVARDDYSFLLESVEGGERLGRYSFIGTSPSLVLRTGVDNPVDPLLMIDKVFSQFRPVPVAGLPRFHGGMVGYLGYEVARYFERLPSPDSDPLGLPESMFMMVDTLLVFDHLTHKIKVVSHVHLDGDIEAEYLQAVRRIESLVERLGQPMPPVVSTGVSSVAPSVSSNLSQAEFESIVSRAKEYIYAGDII